MNDLLKNIRQQLKDSTDAKTQSNSQRFFKEEIKAYGVKVPMVNKISREYFKQLKDLEKEDIFQLCDILWQSGYLEESFVACNWAYAQRKKFEPADFTWFKKWIGQYVNNWASCDTLCNHTVGEFMEMFPKYLTELKQFTASENRWVRRAAAVTLIIPARKGMFLDTVFEIADKLLHDKDDLVQKGYGWMLKAASESHQQAVFDYVVRNKTTMPRTALRYAIEKMPQEMRAKAMEK